MSRTRWIHGRHVVEEALAAGRPALELCVLEDAARSGQTRELERRAVELGLKVRRAPRRELDRLCGTGAHQGLALKVPGEGSQGATEVDLDALLALPDADKASAVVVALDQVQDPHNLGAIARSAACLGARALLLPERRSAPVTQAVLSASAGAIQRIAVVHLVNMAQGLARLKEAGWWIYGADMGGVPAWKARLNRPMVLVVGSEGQGLRPVVRQQCDEIVSVPQAEGGVESLNASCAASVLLYEAARQAGTA